MPPFCAPNPSILHQFLLISMEQMEKIVFCDCFAQSILFGTGVLRRVLKRILGSDNFVELSFLGGRGDPSLSMDASREFISERKHTKKRGSLS